MERTISQEERIRRAEEIYNRRRYEGRNNYYTNIRTNSRVENDISRSIKQKMAKKMIIQMLICVIIYGIIYVIQNSNQLFSQDIIGKAKEILAYDISLDNLYKKASEYFYSIQNNINEESNKAVNEEANNIQDTNQESNLEQNQGEDGLINNQEVNSQNNDEQNVEQQGAIGGSDEILPVQEKTQEEMDIDYVKNNINIIWPLVGTITSRFGARTPTEIVSANHYGIDIAGNIGDTIISAIDGTVVVSTEGESYGKHIKIENGEIITTYAHCSNLLVKEGDTVTQGQKIAEVGETGKATGPHLHFEVRRENRVINPEKILGSM